MIPENVLAEEHILRRDPANDTDMLPFPRHFISKGSLSNTIRPPYWREIRALMACGAPASLLRRPGSGD